MHKHAMDDLDFVLEGGEVACLCTEKGSIRIRNERDSLTRRKWKESGMVRI